jgi:hypothetical protein
MSDEKELIELMVQTHPSGRWTLAGRQGPGIFEELHGELRGNDDALAFYRAVAVYLGKLGAAGARFTYRDMDI